MQDEHSARCIFAQMPAISIWAAVQLSRSSSIHGLCSTETTLVSSPCSGPGEIWQFSHEAKRGLLYIRRWGGRRRDRGISQATTPGGPGDAIRADAGDKWARASSFRPP